jgi:hypothetical protein
MIPAAMLAAAAGHGIWNDTVGLLFTWVVLLPALATGLIVVAIVSGRGEKQADAELRGRWGRKAQHRDDDA